MPIYLTENNQQFITANEIGKGGEGSVYSLTGVSGQVAKIYHQALRTTDREKKLRAMIANPPEDSTCRLSPPHNSIAWPTDLLYENRNFAGFIMPCITKSPNIFEIYNPKIRYKKHPNFDLRYLHSTAKNLATAINALHANNYIIGDVNQKNILVTEKTLISLVDTDSFQVQESSGHIHYCPVGVPEFTPPELQGKSLGNIARKGYHDIFGLSVLIFQILMEGFHPFTGAPSDPTLSINEIASVYCIKHGIFPYNQNNMFKPPPSAPNFDTLNPEVQKLFKRSFIDGHNNPQTRPTAREWIDALNAAERALVQCERNSLHWYSNHLQKCPLCLNKYPFPPALQQPISNKNKHLNIILKPLIFNKIPGTCWTIDLSLLNKNLKWKEAHDFINGLNIKKYLGYSNWRLPNSDELINMANSYLYNNKYMQYGDVSKKMFDMKFLEQNIQYGPYWSCSGKANFGELLVHLWSGQTGYGFLNDTNAFVWPVCTHDSYLRY
jgi:serine/threonine protein kinase